MNILDYTGAWPNTGMDLSEEILHMCVCGSSLFHAVISFEDYEIASYSLDGECIECGTRCKLPCPVDKPGYWSDN